MRRALLLALLALVVPPAASAGTVTSRDGDVVFTAAPGEVNTVAIHLAGDGGVTVLDTAAALTAGSGCAQETPQQARCAAPAGVAVLLDGGDGPDTLDGREVEATLRGGPGNDRLLGGDLASSSCGAGEADVFEPVDPMAIPMRIADCERVRLRRDISLGDLLAWGPSRVVLGAFTVTPKTPVDIVLRMGRTTLGERRLTLQGIGRRFVAVPLTRAGRQRIRRPGVLRVLLRRPGRRPVGFRVAVLR